MLRLDQAFWLTVGLKATVVLGLAWILALVFKRRSAALRHLIWTAGFGAVVILPLLSISVPVLAVPVSASIPAAAVVFRTAASVSPETPAAAQSHAGFVATPASPRAPGPPWLLLVWAVGVLLSMTQLAGSLVMIARLRCTAAPIPGLDLCGWARSLGIRRRVEVMRTRSGSMPMAAGLFHPTVFLPAEAAGWTAERRRVVVLHELAHLRRGDLWTHLIGRTAVSFYWWNPLAWAAWREFLKERERAADDMVLNAGARASDYASHLLEIARTMQARPALGSAALAMARRSQLEGRLQAILDGRTNRAVPHRIPVMAAALLAMAALIPFAALRAQELTATLPADVDATIRAAVAEKNHQMLESAAKAAEVLQKYDLARRLLDSSLEIRAASSGGQSVEYGAGLIKLGDLERSRGNLKEADAFYTKAVSVVGSRPEAVPALIHLGISEWKSTKDPQSARDFFQRAQVADPTHAGPALMWMALIQTNPAEAEDLFKQALSLEFPGSAEQALTMELYSSFLSRQHRDEEAKSLGEKALEARRTLGAQAVEVRRPSGITAVRMGAGVTPPKILFKVEPSYSEEARLAKYQGTVVVATDIGTDGKAQRMRVVRGLGLGLDDQALKAISQWKFQPGLKEGQPVAVQATIEVNFRLL